MFTHFTDISSPISETDETYDGNDEELIENPYIDVNEFDFSDTESDSNGILEEHYAQVPRDTVKVNVRARSHTFAHTGLDTARQKYQDVLFQDLYRSQSLPTPKSKATIERVSSESFENYKNDSNEKSTRSETGSSVESDEVFIQYKHSSKEDKKTTLKRLKTGKSKFSIQFKLTSIKPPTFDSKHDFASRLNKYKQQKSNEDVFVKRNRSDTIPF